MPLHESYWTKRPTWPSCIWIDQGTSSGIFQKNSYTYHKKMDRRVGQEQAIHLHIHDQNRI